MIEDFCILHRRKASTAGSAPQALALDGTKFLVWATCLRSLGFAGLAERECALPGDEFYHGIQAYRFLLEVICGMHSPIVGETEVFGQFKAFSVEWLRREPRRATLVQRLLNDAKAIRNEHLSHLGTRSYGSWVRKNLRAGEVHILGAGLLTRDLLPYLLKQERQVILHVRDPRKVDFFAGEVRQIEAGGFTSGAVIVAAPLTAAEIHEWLGSLSPAQIIDLRDTSSQDPVTTDALAHDLREVFEQLEKNRVRLQPRIQLVHEEIVARALSLGAHSVLRPQGWDDLCA